tara:strand:+ start:47 stop:340 length:294 start_codon:yes stop_codon:yes gene_type:complete
MSSPTKAERKYWDNLAESVGCIVCRNLGLTNNYVSIHHIDGRTKKGCHGAGSILPLCYPHHQGKEGIHPYKRRWTDLHGTEKDLAEQISRILAEEKD